MKYTVFLGVKAGNFGGVILQGLGEKQADFRAETP
jgi:hypothetical protein